MLSLNDISINFHQDPHARINIDAQKVYLADLRLAIDDRSRTGTCTLVS